MNKKIVILVIGLIAVTALSGVAFIYLKQPKVAYVRVPYLYDNFQYKKEMETQLSNITQARKTILDSLQLQLRVLNTRLQNEKKPDEKEIETFEEEKENFLTKKQQFDEDDNNVSKRYADEILKQLTQYIQDYGKENGYTYILGAEGTGSILSADEKNDITNLVLSYVNEKYKGKK